MVCLACRVWGEDGLCRVCRSEVRPGKVLRLPDGLLVRGALLHRGPGRALVHRLKYEGVYAAAEILGSAMARVLPPPVSALVPVPRVHLRRWRFGIDSAAVLAEVLAAQTGLPIARALRPPLWSARHAGRAKASRRTPAFVAVGPVPVGSILVDDVLTTGDTLMAARRAVGCPAWAVTATIALRSEYHPPV